MLQGNLPDITVVDLMHLLASAAKTGVIRFSSAHRGNAQTGAIYFRDGRPVAAETEGFVGTEALEILCSWMAGSFSYHDGATSPRENLDQPSDRLVEQAGAAHEEWKEIWQVLCSPSTVVRPASDLPAGVEQVQVSREQWRILASLRGPQTLSALVQQTGGGLPTYRILKKLAEYELLAVERLDSRD